MTRFNAVKNDLNFYQYTCQIIEAALSRIPIIPQIRDGTIYLAVLVYKIYID